MNIKSNTQREKVTHFVYTIIEDTIGMSRAEIKSTMKLNDIAEDSLSLFAMLITLQKRSDVSISYADIVPLVTIDDVITMLIHKYE